jgi:hypothetical protein
MTPKVAPISSPRVNLDRSALARTGRRCQSDTMTTPRAMTATETLAWRSG